MPPRGNEGLDFTPILTHYLFLFTSILAVVGWFVAFIGQIVTTADFGRGPVGVLWFAIFLQLALILGVLYTLASDSIAMNRMQIAVFGAVAIVFAVEGVNQSIFAGTAGQGAQGAGWLILAIVDILWVLYFTAEEDSLTLHVFNMLGTGGLTPPSRRRRRAQSVHNMGISSANGYGAAGTGYASPVAPQGGGINMGTYDNKMSTGSFGAAGPVRSQGSFNTNTDGGAARSINAPAQGSTPGLAPTMLPADMSGGVNSPLMTPGNAGVGAGGGPGTLPEDTSSGVAASEQTYKAKALYAYTASADDPNEISFAKGEILDIIDKQGKWWQARRSDGTLGIAPSNYLQIV
ncbi:unnamed protein product [Peniophora sp. CBMAI 1063]|nr:unnamed protein product [Peniophora sp. CBMAI 1063]